MGGSPFSKEDSLGRSGRTCQGTLYEVDWGIHQIFYVLKSLYSVELAGGGAGGCKSASHSDGVAAAETAVRPRSRRQRATFVTRNPDPEASEGHDR